MASCLWLVAHRQSYASLINSPAMPKSTNAPPVLSSETATTPMATSHSPTVVSISALPPEFLRPHSRRVPIAS